MMPDDAKFPSRTRSSCLHANSSSWLTSTGSRSMTGRDIVLTDDSIISAPYFDNNQILLSKRRCADSLWRLLSWLFLARMHAMQYPRAGNERLWIQSPGNWHLRVQEVMAKVKKSRKSMVGKRQRKVRVSVEKLRYCWSKTSYVVLMYSQVFIEVDWDCVPFLMAPNARTAILTLSSWSSRESNGDAGLDVAGGGSCMVTVVSERAQLQNDCYWLAHDFLYLHVR